MGIASSSAREVTSGHGRRTGQPSPAQMRSSAHAASSAAVGRKSSRFMLVGSVPAALAGASENWRVMVHPVTPSRVMACSRPESVGGVMVLSTSHLRRLHAVASPSPLSSAACIASRKRRGPNCVSIGSVISRGRNQPRATA